MNKAVFVLTGFLLIGSLFASAAVAMEHQCDPDLVGITSNGGALVRCKNAAAVGSSKISWFAVDIRPHMGVSQDRSILHVLMGQADILRQAMASNKRLLIHFYPNQKESGYDCLASNCREIKDVFIIK